MDPRVHLPSTWRDAKGKPLTTAAIRRYAREGRYGPEMQKRASKRLTLRSDGFIFRCCQCQTEKDLKYRRYSYLPQSGWYCPVCLEQHRKSKELENTLKAKLRKAMEIEYV